jgi:hypothetical protein
MRARTCIVLHLRVYMREESSRAISANSIPALRLLFFLEHGFTQWSPQARQAANYDAPSSSSILGWWTSASKNQKAWGMNTCKAYNIKKHRLSGFIDSEVTCASSLASCADPHVLTAETRMVPKNAIGQAAPQASDAWGRILALGDFSTRQQSRLV